MWGSVHLIVRSGKRGRSAPSSEALRFQSKAQRARCCRRFLRGLTIDPPGAGFCRHARRDIIYINFRIGINPSKTNSTCSRPAWPVRQSAFDIPNHFPIHFAAVHFTIEGSPISLLLTISMDTSGTVAVCHRITVTSRVPKCRGMVSLPGTNLPGFARPGETGINSSKNGGNRSEFVSRRPRE